ncbi:MAG: lysine biosynthesis protein LysW [bacterium]
MKCQVGCCPACGAHLILSIDLVEGELLDCGDCDTPLEVTGLGPVILLELPDANEEWDD